MSGLSFLSVCSGIEAASVAWEPLGFRALGFSEIEAFPSAVLAARYGSNMPGKPLSANGVPNHGDFTAIDTSLIPAPLDVLVGGTPCQAFSIAGKRLSFADARGNLSLPFVVLAHGLARSHGLRNVVWENVPGVLSASDNAFGCFISALVGGDDPILPPGGGSWPGAGMVSGPRARLAWRVLDAQHFGLAQRRARVFVVVDLGGGADPAMVLFERKSLHRNPAPGRKAREGAAGHAAAGAGERGAFGGGSRDGTIAGTVSAKWAKGSGGPAGDEVQNMVAHALRGEGFDASEDGTGRGVPLVPEPFTLMERGRDGESNLEFRQDGTANAILTPSGGRGGLGCGAIATSYAVRRLTPTECERLQGFPDGWTQIAWRGKPPEACPDGPRYRALGNSMAVPVMRWIGERLMAAMPKRAAE